MSARILIAEDHADSLALMQYLLSAHGYTTISAPDGERALHEAHAQLPDLIICDLQMPKLSGFEVVSALRQDVRTEAIPVIAVTAFSMLGDREKVLSAGFNGYFSKPIEPDRFVAQVEPFLPKALRAVRASGG